MANAPLQSERHGRFRGLHFSQVVFIILYKFISRKVFVAETSFSTRLPVRFVVVSVEHSKSVCNGEAREKVSDEESADSQPRIYHTKSCRHRLLRGYDLCDRFIGSGKLYLQIITYLIHIYLNICRT